jgi:plasmid stabilization system protein ParE
VDFRLLYAQRALNDLAEIVAHIGEDDAEAAANFGESLLDHLEFLEKFPRMGSAIRKRARVRKLVHSPIVVYYQIHEVRRLVEILHLRHAAREPAKF